MAPSTHNYPHGPVPGRLYSRAKAQAINEEWIRYGTTGTYAGWVNAYTGNLVIFGLRSLPSSDTEQVQPAKPKKMVDRSQDWKKGGRK